MSFCKEKILSITLNRLFYVTGYFIVTLFAKGSEF